MTGDEEWRRQLRGAAKGPDGSWWFQQLRQALARDEEKLREVLERAKENR